MVELGDVKVVEVVRAPKVSTVNITGYGPHFVVVSVQTTLWTFLDLARSIAEEVVNNLALNERSILLCIILIRLGVHIVKALHDTFPKYLSPKSEASCAQKLS